MRTRRDALAVIGATVLAGCSAQSTPAADETPDDESAQSLTVPLGGLGMYESAVRAAEPLETVSENAEGDPQLTGDQIQEFLDGNPSPEEQAMFLAENTHTHYVHSAMNELYQAQDDKENTVVANINWSFTSDSEPIIEYHTVKNGELQGQPIITDANNGEINIHQPGTEGPEYLKDLRDDTDWAQIVPQDYDAVEERLEYVDEDQRRGVRRFVQEQWSNALFGVNGEPNLVPHDAESSNVVFDGLYHEGDTEAVVELNQQYAESDITDTDEVVSAQYTGSGWEFEVQEDYEMGDELPAHQ